MCNIVIDEMLAYIQNQVSTIDEESLVRICTSTFTSDEIKNSKTLLYESIPTDVRKVLRKSKGKEGRDVIDIINLFKSTEPDIIPVFVARQLDKLPPITMDHLDCSKLLRDMIILKNEIETIKSTFATQDSFNELKTAVLRIQYDSLPPTAAEATSPPSSAFRINRKRGAWTDSGPMGLAIDETLNIVSPCPQYREMGVAPEKSKQLERNLNERLRSLDSGKTCVDADGGERAGGDGLSQSTPPPFPHTLRQSLESIPIAPPQAPAPTPAPAHVVASGCANGSTTASTAVTSHSSSEALYGVNQLTVTVMNKTDHSRTLETHGTVMNQHNNEQPWETVENRRKSSKYRYMGKAGVARDSEGTFRAAEKKIPMFITNVHMSTKESDITNHILNKTREKVALERINMKYDRGHKAYKFFILEANLPKYMNETLWPEGVIVRQFVNYKRRHMNGTLCDTAGPIKLKNG